MDKANRFSGNFYSNKNEKKFEMYHNDDLFNECYGGLQPLRKSYLGYFMSTDDQNRFEDNMFHNEFSERIIQNDFQKNFYKFDFEPLTLRNLENPFEESFNFNLEYTIPNMAHSYPKNELTYDFGLSPNSKKCFSTDNLFESKHEEQNIPQKVTGQEHLTAKEKLKQLSVIPVHQVTPNKKLEERKSKCSNSSESVDSAKLKRLIQCLSKTKGVDKSQIDEEIVARTVEFGQQKVAESLNIPYRRYKSILNKVGIKTNAGRKIKNLRFETELVDWALSIKVTGEVLTRKMIKDKAVELINMFVKDGESSLKKINLSKGWLDKFIKRHQEIRDYLTSQKGKKIST